MYITINDIKGENTIDLSYPICSSKEIAVISMLSENTQYEMTKPLKLKLVDGSEKEVLTLKALGGGGGVFHPPVRFLADNF